MTEIELYYDHYKETFVNLKRYLQLRDRFLLVSLITLALVFFQVHLPEETANVFDALIKNKLGSDLSVDFGSINTLLLVILLGAVVKYFQTNLYIDRTYEYLHQAEKELSLNIKKFSITREGESYLSNYPLVLSLVSRIYTVLFPILLIFCLVQKSAYEVKSFCEGQTLINLLINGSVILLILGVTMLYLVWIHFKDFKRTIEKESD